MTYMDQSGDAWAIGRPLFRTLSRPRRRHLSEHQIRDVVVILGDFRDGRERVAGLSRRG